MDELLRSLDKTRKANEVFNLRHIIVQVGIRIQILDTLFSMKFLEHVLSDRRILRKITRALIFISLSLSSARSPVVANTLYFLVVRDELAEGTKVSILSGFQRV